MDVCLSLQKILYDYILHSADFFSLQDTEAGLFYGEF